MTQRECGAGVGSALRLIQPTQPSQRDSACAWIARGGRYPRPLGAMADCALSLPATGRGCASVLHVAAAGAWKESLDGSRSRRPVPAASGEAPAMAWSPLAAKGLKARPRSASDGASHGPKTGTGQKSPTRGRRKAAQGTPSRSRGALPRGSRGGPAGSPGAGGKPAPGCREAPAYPSHPRPFCRGRTARGRAMEQEIANRRAQAEHQGQSAGDA